MWFLDDVSPLMDQELGLPLEDSLTLVAPIVFLTRVDSLMPHKV